ncbi:ComF family protein [Herminiimonas fonticola]|uniref:ComF family protein n=1 Tax=Herminiimonas fonticola TaxID=303380 RepID=A0A4R6GGS7_9BURK|nr:ComF family protein [Herminiimonas fonticola]RBA25011.1 putative amidophosphoribosyltransferase [Herminiimonas fonticola]TDN94126.1 ComF family protein [Herminiimonas fonticola]
MHYRFLDWTRHFIRQLPAALPSSCALCGVSGADSLCQDCNSRFFSQHPHRCSQCASPLAFASDKAERCGNCLSNPPAFDTTIVASDYTAPIDQLVLALKFGNRLALAPLFARMLRDAILREPAFTMPTLLAAVPLGEKRLAERGFNQALEIAKPLARAIAIPLAPQLIERTRDTLMQAMLPTAERHRNIRHAFALPANAVKFVRGQHIGLVDDVLTTGETLNEIAATLKRHGAVRVTNLVFARTPHK